MKNKTLQTSYSWEKGANILLSFSSLLALLPFLLLVMASFTDEKTAIESGYSFFPKKLSLNAYRYIASQSAMIGRAYIMTIIVTAAGTTASIIITSLLAYMLAQKELPGHRILNFTVLFTMLFNGGLVPTYIMYVSTFHIKNTLFGLIVPNLLMNAFNIMLVRNYFQNSIPKELYEAATIDGADEYFNFFQITVPLSVPILATVGLMTGLTYWNDWQNGLYYLDAAGKQLYTVQNILNNINESIEFLASNATVGVDMSSLPTKTIRMAIALVGILPILVTYPFFQKYFAQGLTMGAIKG